MTIKQRAQETVDNCIHVQFVSSIEGMDYDGACDDCILYALNQMLQDCIQTIRDGDRLDKTITIEKVIIEINKRFEPL